MIIFVAGFVCGAIVSFLITQLTPSKLERDVEKLRLEREKKILERDLQRDANDLEL